VCSNQVYAAVERQGPRVVGDGRHNIKELIDFFNTDRSVNNMKSDTQLPLIVFNDDLKDYLNAQSLTLDDIPGLGNVTELRAANNVSGGGSFYSIFDKVHPDNIELAIRISQFMRLDIVGIDFLISDISISWKDVKCGICEINTQPQISGDKHKYVLQKTLRSNGRIPTLLFLGKFNGFSIHDKALQCLIPKGLNVGFANSDSAWINHEKILKGSSGISRAGAPLLLNPSVDFLLLELDLSAQVLPILPVDKVDAILISHNIPELIQDPKKVIWLKKILRFSKHIISFSGQAELLSRNLKIPSQFVNDLYPGDIESFFNQLIQKG
jgi:cyanophycin synthetase